MQTPSPHVVTGILQAIGHTPLIRLQHFLARSDVELFAKLEAANPGGSAKDRPALAMLDDGLRRGCIGPLTTIVESSSGNMGIGLAQACRYYRLRFVCVVDSRAQPQNVAIVKALGGEVLTVDDPSDGDFLAARIAKVQELRALIPNSYWPNQYANPVNPRAHYLGTIREIDEALQGQFDVLLVATSSTGTAQGCRDFLKQRGRETQVIAVDAVGSVLFGGTVGPRRIPGLGASVEPGLAAGQAFDRVVRVMDLDCVIGCRRAAEREAMLVGGSAGGVLQTAWRLQDQLAGKRCVAVLHDSGTRYLETVFNDEWVESKLGCPLSRLNSLISSPRSDEARVA